MKTANIKQALLITIFLAAFTGAGAQNSPATKKTTTVRELRSDGNIEVNALRGGDSRIHFEKDGKEYYMKLVDDKLTELTVDGVKVPADSMHLYKELIDSMTEQMKKDRAQAEEDRKQAALDRVQAEKDRAQAVKDRAQAEKDREQAMKDRANAEKDREEVNRHRDQAVRDRAQAEKDRQQAVKDRAQAERDREQASKDRAQAEIDRKHAEEDRALVKSLLESAVKDGLTTSAEGVTRLELSDEGFWINGTKQSTEMHTKYKAFLKKPGARISMNRNYSSTTISL